MGHEFDLEYMIDLKSEIDDLKKDYSELNEDFHGGNYAITLSDKIISKERLLHAMGRTFYGNHLTSEDIETKLEEEIKRRAKQERNAFFDTVIYLKKQYDKDNNNISILDKIARLMGDYYDNAGCFTKTRMLKIIDEEEKRRKQEREKQRVIASCERAIANLERKINDPEGYMEDALWRTRSFYNKRRKVAVDSASNNAHSSKNDISYSLKGN